ncbi:MAG: PKD domain-containing protein [Bacteroidota bacterium]|nr:PKD domain-containing protein [Bacteroidota bacterium]
MKKRNIFLTCLSVLIMGIIYSCSKDDMSFKLEAKFDANKQEIVAGDTITFSDISTGDPSSWKWTFEGGNPSTSNLTTPKVIYNTPGSYKVILSIGKKGDTTSLLKDAFIVVDYDKVKAGFNCSSTTVNQGNQITFTDQSTGIPTKWLWKFYIKNTTDTLTSTEKNPIITFDNPGIYSVSLKVTNPKSSDEILKQDLLTIIDVTSVDANFSSVYQSTYEGGSINFTDKSLGTVTNWNWTFEGGNPATSTAQNPTVTYATAGRYTVKLIASNSAKSSTKEIIKDVLVVPGNGIVAFYPFDGNGKDAGPNKVNATNKGTGTILYNDPDRKTLNSCATFDGASVLVAPDNPAFNFGTGDFSIACWVKSNSVSKMLLWMESGGILGTGDLQTWLRIGDNTTTKKIRFDCEDASGSNIVNCATGVSDGSWHQVVCVREGLTSNIYIDGTLIASQAATSIKEVSSSQPFKIGAQEGVGGGTYSNYFSGSMDELILYNRALTATEVSNLYGL